MPPEETPNRPVGTPGKHRPLARPKFRIYERGVPDDASVIVEVDGRVPVRKAVIAVFDHHRSGEPVSYDVIPEHSPAFRGAELATHSFDADYLVAAVLLYRRGLHDLMTMTRRHLRAVAEWRDLGFTTESDNDIAAAADRIELALALSYRREVQRLLAARGEAPTSAATDRDQSIATTLLARRLLQMVRSGTFVSTDASALDVHRLREQERWRESIVHVDDELSMVEVDESVRFGIRDIQEILQTPLHVQSSPLTAERSTWRYTISLAPKRTGEYELRPLLSILNSADPAVLSQSREDGRDPDLWGGRAVVLGSPKRIGSSIQPSELIQILHGSIGNLRADAG